MNMSKAGVLLSILLLSILVVNLALAEDQALVDKAYTCLEGKVNKCSGVNSVEDQAFSILALAYKSDIFSPCKTALMNNAKDNECWPKASCKIKETAEAVLALNYIGQDTSKPEAWLLKQNKTPTDLNWYLEIDARDATSCTVKYDNSTSVSHTITMAGDKKLSLSGSGSCLSLANANYWLQISSSCTGKTFKVSCDKDFFTALLYKKSNSDIWYVSSKTQAASASGITENKVSSFCFAQSGNCDYEGSLWAALSLQSKNNIDSFLPYLIAFAPDNLKYNPYSFLNRIALSDEYTNNLRNNQNPAGFWDLTSGFGRNYDTAISIIGMSTLSDSPEIVKSKDWLQSVQGSDGCWNTIKDTALILYAAWPKTPASGTGGVDIDYCEDYSKFCLSHTECADAVGEVLDNYQCRDGVSVCCSNDLPEKSCSEKQGIVCQSDEECSGSLASAQDTSRCCIDGDCAVPVLSGCEQNNFNCRSSCSGDEEIKSGSGNDCSGSNVCCGIKTPKPSYWWLWLLIILIILVALAIIFRNRLRVFIFKFKNKGGKASSVQQTRPPFPPSASLARPGMMPRPMPRSMPQSPVRAKSRTDTELDETLKKLKEMSK